MNNNMTMTAGLCEGRHPMPVDSYLFPQVVEDPTDLKALYDTADKAIPSGTSNLILYVSGLTQALTAAIKVCQDRAISLTLMHYDCKLGVYWAEPFFAFKVCWACGERYMNPNGAQFCPYCGAD